MKILNWANLKFPFINKKDTLQDDIDYLISEAKEIDREIIKAENAIKSEIDVMKYNYMFKKLAEKQLKALQFQHYLRTGKFND